MPHLDGARRRRCHLKGAGHSRRTNPRAPSPTGRAWCDFLHRADPPTKTKLRRRSTPGNPRRAPQRPMSADGVGRRGHFLKGRSLPRFKQSCPLRKCTERGRKADPKAGVRIQRQIQRQIQGQRRRQVQRQMQRQRTGTATDGSVRFQRQSPASASGAAAGPTAARTW